MHSRRKSDENQIKEAFINEGRGHSPSQLKFFLLVFSKLKKRGSNLKPKKSTSFQEWASIKYLAL